MKLALWLAFVTCLSAQDCSHQTAYTPLGSVSMFRNGLYLQSAEIVRTAVAGTAHPKFSPVAFADQDQVAILYTRAVYLPTIQPLTTWSYSLVREEWTCTGNLNPPPKPTTVVRKLCQGSGTRPFDGTTCTNVAGCPWNCAGIELYAYTFSDGTTRYYSAVVADQTQVSLPDCPSSDLTKGCWQVAPLADPPAAGVRAAFIVIQALQ
jgi:hypothetical protein